VGCGGEREDEQGLRGQLGHRRRDSAGCRHASDLEERACGAQSDLCGDQRRHQSNLRRAVRQQQPGGDRWGHRYDREHCRDRRGGCVGPGIESESEPGLRQQPRFGNGDYVGWQQRLSGHRLPDDQAVRRDGFCAVRARLQSGQQQAVHRVFAFRECERGGGVCVQRQRLDASGSLEHRRWGRKGRRWRGGQPGDRQRLLHQ